MRVIRAIERPEPDGPRFHVVDIERERWRGPFAAPYSDELERRLEAQRQRDHVRQVIADAAARARAEG